MGPCILSFALNMCARIHINCLTYTKMKYNKKLHNILIIKLKKEMTKKKQRKQPRKNGLKSDQARWEDTCIIKHDKMCNVKKMSI